MSKRAFLLVILVLVISLLLGACAPSDEMEEPSGESVEEPMEEEMEAQDEEPAEGLAESESGVEEVVNAALTITGLVENEMALDDGRAQSDGVNDGGCA